MPDDATKLKYIESKCKYLQAMLDAHILMNNHHEMVIAELMRARTVVSKGVNTDPEPEPKRKGRPPKPKCPTCKVHLEQPFNECPECDFC